MHFDIALQQQGYTGRVKSLTFEQIEAPAEIAQKLQLSGSAPQVYRQKKIIYADDTPIALEIDYFPLAIASPLTAALQQGFTYSTLTPPMASTSTPQKSAWRASQRRTN